MTEKKVIFTCGKWNGNPPKGQFTPRRCVGHIRDDWGVFFWMVENKSAAAQFHVQDGFFIGKNIFFPTESEAEKWIMDPINPTLDEIKSELRKCQWHKPSRGLIQVWVDFKRV